MNVSTRRFLARASLGAAALLAFGSFAAPAYAAGTEADLEITLAGTTVAAGAEGKLGFVKVANKGPNTPAWASVFFNLSEVDPTKLIAGPIPGFCDFTPGADVTCPIPSDLLPGPGETLELPMILVRAPGATGPYSADLMVSVESPDDPTPGNNTKTVAVTLSELSGVDLGVLVPDVRFKLADPDDESTAPIHPGDSTIVAGLTFNHGDVGAKGIKVIVQLPEQVTFAEVEEGCAYAADNRTATCTYPDITLAAKGDVILFWWPITVGADVAAPVTLPDGSFTVEALGVVPPDAPAARSGATKLPDNVKVLTAEEADLKDVDETDNSDGFAVIVAIRGGSGGLPITGAKAGLIGGVGAAVLVAGWLLFLVARRRRVILVTPTDG